jgi:hypothetical protein
MPVVVHGTPEAAMRSRRGELGWHRLAASGRCDGDAAGVRRDAGTVMNPTAARAPIWNDYPVTVVPHVGVARGHRQDED